jgi:hypothetical protein
MNNIGQVVINNDSNKNMRVYSHTLQNIYNYPYRDGWNRNQTLKGWNLTFCKKFPKVGKYEAWETITDEAQQKKWDKNSIMPVPFDKNGKPKDRWIKNGSYKQNGVFTGMVEITSLGYDRCGDAKFFPNDEYHEHLPSEFTYLIDYDSLNKLMKSSVIEEGFVLNTRAFTFQRMYGYYYVRLAD